MSTTFVSVAPPTCIVGSTATRRELWRPVKPEPAEATPGDSVTPRRSANVRLTTDWFAPVSRSHGPRTPLTTHRDNQHVAVREGLTHVSGLMDPIGQWFFVKRVRKRRRGCIHRSRCEK